MKKYLNCLLLLIATIAISICKITRHSKDIFSKHYPFVEANKGLMIDFPENTLLSINKSILQNIESVRLDIWITKDDVPITASATNGVLDRIYNNQANISELTLQEVKRIKTVKLGEVIPSLEEVLKLISPSSLFLTLNLPKHHPKQRKILQNVLGLLSNFHLMDRAQLSSEDFTYFELLQEYEKEKNQHVIFGFLYNKGTKETNVEFGKPGNVIELWWGDVKSSIVSKAHENKMAVTTYFTEEEKENIESYRKLFDLKADIIVCTRPQLLDVFRYTIINK